MFSSALALARDKHADLVVAPEYSVPWSALEHELEHFGGPNTGQLWVLGCESLTIIEVVQLISRFERFGVVMHEDVDPESVEPTTAQYMNPLVYLFRTKVIGSANERLAIIVQFKTEPSGDPENTEVEGMARGQEIYLFEGPRDQVRLITFICSDVLSLSGENLDRVYEESLIIHIQLNERPRTTPYAAYRRRLFNAKCDRSELICLNWASGITYHIEGKSEPVQKTNASCSSWSSRSSEIATSDERVEPNQRKGLYYTHHDKEKLHMLHFSFQPAAFLLRATKVKHSGVPAGQSYRRGPELLEVFEWKDGEWGARTEQLSDGFQQFCLDFEGVGAPLQVMHQASPLGVERATLITCGEFIAGNTWHHANNLSSAKIGDDEIVNRVTVTQDPDSNSIAKRGERVSKLKALSDLGPHIPFRAPLEDLRAGFAFRWSASHPFCNVESNDSARKPATIVFAGIGLASAALRGLYAKTATFARASIVPDRFCVVYLDGATSRVYEPVVSNPFTSDKAPGSADFTEPEA
jgi:hypothetical protein